MPIHRQPLYRGIKVPETKPYPCRNGFLLAIAAGAIASSAWAGADAQTRPALPITTVAGNGTAGYVVAQDGGLAIQAQLDEPYGTAIDGAGNLYIADRANNRVRRVDAATGIISTVAGTGAARGTSQDGSPALSVALNGPRAVALDDAGNLYIADTQNHRVLKVNAQGTATTIAGTGVAGYRLSQDGGRAILAQLDSPRGLALDPAGNLYITDYNNERIRKVAANTGIITTVAGTGAAGYMISQDGGPAMAAELNHPDGIAADRSGNLYIADTDNHRIRKVDAASHTITTLAGTGIAGYNARDEDRPAIHAALNAPCGVAVDRTGNVYIADFDNSRIRRVAAGTGLITTLAGNGIAGYITWQDGAAATAARLNKPRGVTVDHTGNVYIADYNNSRIRKVTVSTGIYVAGN